MKRPLAFLSATLLLSTAVLSFGQTPADSPQTVQPLAVGAKMPAVSVHNAAGDAVALASLTAGKPTILIFYRGGWCPYCTRHLAVLQEIDARLTELGYQMLALSPDTPAALAAAQSKHAYSYQLISDRAMEASAGFGLAFRLDEKTRKAYEGYGFDLAPVPSEPESRWLPVPAVFVLDRSGTVRFVHANDDYKVRVSNADLLAAAERALAN